MEANTASGTLSNAFDDLRVHGQWGAHRITGRLGAGTGRLRATTVSGSIALLRRPPRDEEGTPGETEPPTPPRPPAHPTRRTAPPPPGGQFRLRPGGATATDASATDATGAGDAPADGTTDKKVL